MLLTKYPLSLSIKIALFMAVMLLVAKAVPYHGMVESIAALIDYQSASAFNRFILGEPAPEVWEATSDYFSLLIGIVISVPVMSAVVTLYNAGKHKMSPAEVLREWARSTLRRFAKVFGFTLLFWALFRLLPYPYLFPQQTYSNFTLAAVFGFQLFLTAVCYGFITKVITIKRRS